MTEWKDTSEGLPADGELVEVLLVDGRKLKPVEFAAGRFWKFRQGTGGHAHDVMRWRPIEAPVIKKGRVDGPAESKD